MHRRRITVLTRTAYSLIKVGQLIADTIGARFIKGKYTPNTVRGVVILVGNPDPYFFFLASKHTHNEQIWYLTTEGPVKILWTRRYDAYVVANSQYVKDKLEESGFHVDDIVYHGVRFRVEQPTVGKALKFIYVAGYLKRKYPPACEKIIRWLGKKLLLVTTMNNPYMRDFDLISIYDAPHVRRRYPSRVCTDEVLINLYRDALFYLNFSDTEGFGETPLEAMCFGAVPILPRIRPLTEWCPKECAYWFKTTGRIEYEPYGAHQIEHRIYTTKALWNVINKAEKDEKGRKKKVKECQKLAKKMYYKDVYQKFLEFV